MMLDIDHFKKVNDTYGHLIGDEVLKTTAKTISSSVRRGDVIGRYGGEEFIVIVSSITQDKILKIAEKIRKTLKEITFNFDNKSFFVTISIGIAKYDKDIDIDTLIGNADKALYKAKKSGRDNIVFYEEEESNN